MAEGGHSLSCSHRFDKTSRSRIDCGVSGTPHKLETAQKPKTGSDPLNKLETAQNRKLDLTPRTRIGDKNS